MVLYSLAANCNYGALEGEMIRDRLVVGIQNAALSQRLQMDAALTLEKAKTTIRQQEAVKEQQSILSGSEGPNVDAIRQGTEQGRSRDRQDSQQRRSSRPPKPSGGRWKERQPPTQQCTRCGKEPHTHDKCPAKEAICHRCQKKGHYSTQCRSTNIDESGLETAFLDAATMAEGETAWFAEILVGKDRKGKVTFKLDTGAEVTAVSQETYQMFPNAPPLRTPQRTLCGPSRKPLQVLGECQVVLTHGERSSTQQLFVMKGLRSNLLGLPAIKALSLATRLDEATAEPKELSSAGIHERFRKLFQGLGKLGESYEIRLKQGATPFALFTPRRIPLPLREKVSEELQQMETMGVISKVDIPTPWCAGMVVAPKKSGAIRICVDLKPLNQCVLREVHPLTKVDDTLAQLTGAKLFSKLDANSGFWQIPLAPSSRLLTTFITPFGRFCFNKLPFGISSAPEHFQKRMSQILSGLEGVVCQMDDVLVFGSDKRQHDTRLLAVLERIEAAGATLNKKKCEFGTTSVKFLGHLIHQTRIRADPEKTRAIREMPTQTSVTGLRRFLGMVNQLGKFTPHLAEFTQPLRGLLSKGNTWMWGPDQDTAFIRIKEELSKPTVLALYDSQAPTTLSADASSYGLGAVLLQKANKQWRPVAYASRSMTETEQRYAQIEKEALAITWACEKFSDYILGRPIEIETDHKPLVPLLTNKQLDKLPPRVLRFRLRMDRFTYGIHHVPGKNLHTADTLSRAPLSSTEHDHDPEHLAELLMVSHIQHLPASKERLETYRQAQNSYPTCSRVKEYCQKGWPDKHKLATDVKPYWPVRGELTIGEDLLLCGGRVVVPRQMQDETIRKLHQGHQGIQRCRLRAQSAVWWPGLSKQISDFVGKCPECCRDALPQREPLMTSTLPDYPWQKAATDLFELKGTTYLVVVDYFSRFPEVIQMNSTTSRGVISALKTLFARYGIPEVLVSDNGPQYSSTEFAEFATAYGFVHSTSSPHYPQSNGLAERTVRTAKKLIKEAPDPCLALLAYRTTPLPWCGLSPAELCQGRRLRTDVPQPRHSLSPLWPCLDDFRKDDAEFKRQQKKNFDDRHRTRPLPELPAGTEVWTTTNRQHTEGIATPHLTAPRSYTVTTDSGTVRRNRSQLNIVPQPTTQPAAPPPPTAREPVQTRTRTGTPMAPPQRF